MAPLVRVTRTSQVHDREDVITEGEVRLEMGEDYRYRWMGALSGAVLGIVSALVGGAAIGYLSWEVGADDDFGAAASGLELASCPTLAAAAVCVGLL